jgi:uncharacterized membrane-anchored protein YitT (DUF2179 family)
MQSKNWQASLLQIFPILLGTAIYAFGLHYFIIPNQLMEGGVTGIALLLNYSMNLAPSYTILILNIPLFFVGWKVFGPKGMVYTIIGTVGVSFFLWVMERLIEMGWMVPFKSDQDYFLATLYAGVTIGAGLGIVFRYGGTTGGIDIIARILHKTRGASMGQTILFFDAIVIGLSLFYIKKEQVLYTLVAVFIASRVIDFLSEGAYAAKAFTVVTDMAPFMSDIITKEMDRGVTLFTAKGAFSGSEKEVVYCVVYRHEVRKLKALVRQIDPKAFIVIHDVQDVLGEGFKLD